MIHPKKPDPWSPPAPPPGRLESPRFVIRAYTADDAPRLFRVIDHHRESYLPWLPWAATQYRSAEATAAMIEKVRASAADPLDAANNAVLGYIYGVFERGSGDLMGGAGVNRLTPESHNAETGYWVRPDRRRRGIATEVLAAMISAGFRPQPEGGFGFRRIHLFAARANTPSCGVPPKLGLRQCMQTRQDRWLDGMGWCDFMGWEVLASEWDCAAARLRA